MSKKGFICSEPNRTCEYCGKDAECRPYGKNGEQICFKCGMKDIETTEKRAAQYLFGEED